jgi:tetratricopeptide (TPR) repeat protein
MFKYEYGQKNLPADVYFIVFGCCSGAGYRRAGLIKQGIQLNNQQNYAGAIEKYKQALTAEPDNAQANYQLAFSLNASGKGTDGHPVS